MMPLSSIIILINKANTHLLIFSQVIHARNVLQVLQYCLLTGAQNAEA